LTDEYLSTDGRFMDSMLSEHMCEGWLEGYLLTGRHGFFDTYEAFARIIDSMAAQHAKWLKVCNQLPWREEIASLNIILTSHIWQQDHNGFTHQDPGFLDHIANKKADVVRLYLPPDTNTLLSTFDHCIRSKNYVNVIVASKHPRPQWLSMPEAVTAVHARHRHLGVGEQRSGPGAGCGHGLLRRHADAGNPGRRLHPEPGDAGAEDPRHQRRRPLQAAAARRASARPDR
jgi:phosphoketolase